MNPAKISQKFLTLRGFLGFALTLIPLLATDYTANNLPQNLFAPGKDQVTPNKSSQGWDISTIGLGDPRFLRISGSGQYTLSIIYPKGQGFVDGSATFYSSGIEIQGVGLSAKFDGMHTLAIEKGKVNIGSGASLSVKGSLKKIRPSGTEYGGSAKVRFTHATTLNLESGSRASFEGFYFFIHDGTISLAPSSTLTIATDTIRIQKRLLNNQGILTLKGNVYNIGSKLCKDSACIQDEITQSYFESTSGQIQVTGNFYNGGQVVADGGNGFNTYDPPFGGGGKLILKGGKMDITGNFISQRGGTPIQGGGWFDYKDSEAYFYGASLNVGGSFQNAEGSLLTLGAYESKLAKVTATDFRNQGSIIVDLAGFMQEGRHQLVLGKISTNENVTLINGNSSFITSELSYDASHRWDGWITVKVDQEQIKHTQESFTPNQKAILGAFGEGIWGIGGVDVHKLKSDSNTLESHLAKTFLSMPYELIDTLKDQIPHPHTCQSVRYDAGVLTGGMAREIGGGFGGMRGGVTLALPACLSVSLHALYAYAGENLAQEEGYFLHSNAKQSTHTIGLEASLQNNERVSFIAKLGYFGSFIDSQRRVTLQALRVDENLHSKFSYHHFAIDALLGYRFDLPYSITLLPYSGLLQSYNSFLDLKENGGERALSLQRFGAYFLSIPLGLQARYMLDLSKSLGLDLSVEQFVVQSSPLALQTEQKKTIVLKDPFKQHIKLKVDAEFALPAVSISVNGYFKTTIHKRAFYTFGVGAGAVF